ncbi:MarR family winged helix-turn-helix transcriptional regulator [Nocardia sp. NPDC003482]|uniref:MarR family winged helix-turn-helix transcriptional regulator n=1 Tax=Nocardia sp. NPDC004068 TaxID=3364303 RepID=UPI00368A4062
MKDEEAVAAIERAMVAIRRSQSRRNLSRLHESSVDPTLFLVLDAVESHDDAATVTDIAQALSVDQPRASRLVARAVSEGLLRREADQSDARRVLLRLTPVARRALEQGHRVRREVFARSIAGWSSSERVQFARLLTRFVGDFSREL